MPTFLWDITLGKEYDFIRNKSRAFILGWILRRQVHAVHLGTYPVPKLQPCPRRPRWIAPLRSDALPPGLLDRRPGDQRAIKIGSALMAWLSLFL